MNVQTFARALYNSYQDCITCAPASAQASLKAMQHQTLVSQFVENLYASQLRFEMKRYVLDNKDAKFDEVRQRAMHLDTMEDKKSAETFSYPATMQPVQRPQAQSNRGHANTDRLTKLEETVTNMHAMLQNMQKSNPDTLPQHPQLQGNPNNTRRCFHCNDPGHVQRFCPHRRPSHRDRFGGRVDSSRYNGPPQTAYMNRTTNRGRYDSYSANQQPPRRNNYGQSYIPENNEQRGFSQPSTTSWSTQPQCSEATFTLQNGASPQNQTGYVISGAQQTDSHVASGGYTQSGNA